MISKYIKKRNQKIGMFVADKNTKTEAITIGWSLCDKKDGFDKKRAFEMAHNRALKSSYGTIDSKAIPMPHSLIKSALKFERQAERYFKGEQCVILR